MSTDKKAAIRLAQKHGNDVGSTGVQIAILTDEINNLNEHLQKNKKDLHSKRGLMKKLSHRRKLIKYMKRTDPEGWAELAEKIGLKK